MLVDKYLDRADELDVDALCDKDGNVTICGIMQHIEQARRALFETCGELEDCHHLYDAPLPADEPVRFKVSIATSLKVNQLFRSCSLMAGSCPTWHDCNKA